MKKVIILLFLLSFSASCAFSADKAFYVLEGKKLTYEDLVSSPKTVLFIWTTWCPYCIRKIYELSKECEPFKGVNLIYLNVGQSEHTVQKFIRSKRLKECVKKNIVLDIDSIVPRKFSIYGIPAFVIFKDGEAIHKSSFINKNLIKKIFED